MGGWRSFHQKLEVGVSSFGRFQSRVAVSCPLSSETDSLHQHHFEALGQHCQPESQVLLCFCCCCCFPSSIFGPRLVEWCFPSMNHSGNGLGDNDRAARVLFVQHPQEQSEWLYQSPRYAQVLAVSFTLLPRVLDEQHSNRLVIIPIITGNSQISDIFTEIRAT